MQFNFTNTMKMDDFFGDFDTFLDNESTMDNGSFYNEYLDLFKLNKRQNFFKNYLQLLHQGRREVSFHF